MLTTTAKGILQLALHSPLVKNIKRATLPLYVAVGEQQGLALAMIQELMAASHQSHSRDHAPFSSALRDAFQLHPLNRLPPDRTSSYDLLTVLGFRTPFHSRYTSETSFRKFYLNTINFHDFYFKYRK